MGTYFIPWTQDMGLQVDELNQGHHRLMDKLNSLLTATSSNDQMAVLLAFNELTAEVESHFDAEEKLMREISYPLMEEHCAHHGRLWQTLDEIRFRVSGAQFFPDEGGLFESIEQWLVPHLTHDDKKLADFLAARPPPASAAAARDGNANGLNK
ncbi:MAG: hemerythrin family protein [Burkholderiales bacterium]